MKHGAALEEALATAACAAEDEALSELLTALQDRGYQFVTPNNRTHRILRKRDGERMAGDLRDILGWSLPFTPGAVDQDVETLLDCTGRVELIPEGVRATIRVSTVEGRLFLHSAFGARTDAVFLGPDTYRFATFLRTELAKSASPVVTILDVGAGAGVGGVLAAALTGAPHVTLADINPDALRLARLNARHAGVEVRTLAGTGLDEAERYDLIIANPPFIAEAGRTYSDGGAKGTELSLDWARRAVARLQPGGRFLLYTGSPITHGRDDLRAELESVADSQGCVLAYHELDPDIFSEELRRPAYAGVERIAAVGAVIRREAPYSAA